MASDSDIIVDLDELDNELEDEIVEDIEEETALSEEEIKAEPALPDKFKGKSAEEIYESYANLEKEYGRRGSEIHELRQLADQFIKQEFNKAQSSNTDEEDDEDIDIGDLSENPRSVIDKRVEKGVKKNTQKLESEVTEMKRQLALKDFQTNHPDYLEVGNDPKFQEWIQAHPVRAQRFQDANDNYNFDYADELLSEWKERQSFVQKVDKEVEKAQTDEELKAAVSESGASTGTRRKIYKRSKLIEKRVNDPAWYEANLEEIQKAYIEGRVK